MVFFCPRLKPDFAFKALPPTPFFFLPVEGGHEASPGAQARWAVIQFVSLNLLSTAGQAPGRSKRPFQETGATSDVNHEHCPLSTNTGKHKAGVKVLG